MVDEEQEIRDLERQDREMENSPMKKNRTTCWERKSDLWASK